MADSAEGVVAPVESSYASAQEPAPPDYFRGAARNLVPGIAMLLAAAAAFGMNLTHVFFAEAIAWVFMIWGALLVLVSLLDTYQVFEVTDDGLHLRNYLRFWNGGKVWGWAEISRLEVVVGNKDRRPQDATLRVFYTAPGELAFQREDRAFDAQLAQAIIERAGLKPTAKDNPQDLAQLNVERGAVYTWQ